VAGRGEAPLGVGGVRAGDLRPRPSPPVSGQPY